MLLPLRGVYISQGTSPRATCLTHLMTLAWCRVQMKCRVEAVLSSAVAFSLAILLLALHSGGRLKRDPAEKRFGKLWDVPVVVPLCNGTDYRGWGARDQLDRANRLACSLKSSPVRKVAMTYSMSPQALKSLRDMGYEVIDLTSVPAKAFTLKPMHTPPPASKGGGSRPERRYIPGTRLQDRNDFGCTSFKLLAWNLTQFSRIFMVDSDIFFMEDPAPWLEKHRGSHFIAQHEQGIKMYDGIQSNVMMLKPNEDVAAILLENAVTGGFLPFTNGDQDVIESVYSSHKVYPPLPYTLHQNTEWLKKLACSDPKDQMWHHERMPNCSGVCIEQLKKCDVSCRSLQKKVGFSDMTDALKLSRAPLPVTN